MAFALGNVRTFQFLMTARELAFAAPAIDAPAGLQAPIALPLPPAGTFATFVGTSGNDVQDGTTGDDDFIHTQGGNDTLRGLTGEDRFFLAATFSRQDRIDGGADFDELHISGNYAGGVVFAANTVRNIDLITCAEGNSYNLTLHAATIAAGELMLIDAAGLDAGQSLLVDGTAVGASRTLIALGGADSDYFIGAAGNNALYGGAAIDTFDFGENFDPVDIVDGGGGSDHVILNGDYSDGSLDFGPGTMTGVERLTVTGGFAYNIATHDSTVGFGKTLTVVAVDALVIFNGLAETNGQFDLIGDDAPDILLGGARADRIYGAMDSDRMASTGGADTFAYAAAAESSLAPGSDYDFIGGFNFNICKIDIAFSHTVTAIDPALNTGRLREASFNADMELAVNAARLGASHALLFTPSTGNLAGNLYMIIDINLAAGYQVGDMVIELDGATKTGNFDTGDFI
jgi:Ca2+-binding RTX toxin-like protein